MPAFAKRDFGSCIMTISRLETYRSLKRQVEIWEAELNPSIIKGVNFENVVVQSGKTSNPTADFAMQKIENECAAEYLRQKAERTLVIRKLRRLLYADI